MQVVHGREQGCWAHPALYEIGKTIPHCMEMRYHDSLGPCPTRTYRKREEWCENCVAREALTELRAILEHASDHGCGCKDCARLRDFIENGAENDRKHGIRSFIERKDSP